MRYTEQQINNRINAIQSRYANFESLTLLRQNDSGIYFTAEQSNGLVNNLRLQTTEILYLRQDGEWHRVENFRYYDESE